MNVVDYVIIGILVISTGISFLRGFMREMLSLVVWVAAVWIAIVFTPQMSSLLAHQITNESVRLLASFLGLFIATLIVGSLANLFVGQLVKKTGFSGTDRMIGLLFGFVRGGIIVSVLIFAIGMTKMPSESWWKGSVLVPRFEPLTAWLGKNFPNNLPTQFAFDSGF